MSASTWMAQCPNCQTQRKFSASNKGDTYAWCTYCEQHFLREILGDSPIRIRISIGTAAMTPQRTDELLRVARLLGVKEDMVMTFASSLAYFDISADFLLTCVDLQELLIERGALNVERPPTRVTHDAHIT